MSNNKKNEKIVVFSIYTLGPNNSKAKTPLLGYNLDTKTFDWVKDYSSISSEFSVDMYSNNNGLVYTFGGFDNNYILAFDVNNGEVAWQKPIQFQDEHAYFYNNKIIVTVSNSPQVFCFDQKTGNQVWVQKFNSIHPQDKYLVNFDMMDCGIVGSYLLSTKCDNLMVLDLKYGDLLYLGKTALPEGCLQHGMAIDKTNRIFYVDDRKRIVAYKLPNWIKY